MIKIERVFRVLLLIKTYDLLENIQKRLTAPSVYIQFDGIRNNLVSDLVSPSPYLSHFA